MTQSIHARTQLSWARVRAVRLTFGDQSAHRVNSHCQSYPTVEHTLRPDGDPVTARVHRALCQIYRLPDWIHDDPVGHLLEQYAALRAAQNALDCPAKHELILG